MNRERIERELALLRDGGQIAELIENGRGGGDLPQRTDERRKVRTANRYGCRGPGSLRICSRGD